MGNEKSRPSGGGKLAAVGLGKKGPSVSELVERAQRTGVLNLSGAGLKEIPANVLQLAAFLRNLDLNNNRITLIPPFVGDFSSLKQLHLDNNRITELPDELGHLKKLETLSLCGNEVSSIPDSLISCTALKTLQVANNRLTAFPTPLAHLPALEMADLTGNRLSTLPDIVADCRAVELIFNRNQLSTLNAPALTKAPRLKVLRVEENCLPIEEFSEELLSQSKVSVLAVEGNLFQEKDLHHQPGYEAFMERYTQSRKKMF